MGTDLPYSDTDLMHVKVSACETVICNGFYTYISSFIQNNALSQEKNAVKVETGSSRYKALDKKIKKKIVK